MEVRRQESESQGLVLRDFLETGSEFRGAVSLSRQHKPVYLISELLLTATRRSRIQEQLATEIARHDKIEGVGAAKSYTSQNDLAVRL